MTNGNKPREWTLLDGGSYWYVDGPAPERFSQVAVNIRVIERSAFEALRAELDELKARLPVFIKLDETTEAFVQTHAAIENMKIFQKESLELQVMNRQLRADLNLTMCQKETAIEAKGRLNLLIGEVRAELTDCEYKLSTALSDLNTQSVLTGEAQAKSARLVDYLEQWLARKSLSKDPVVKRDIIQALRQHKGEE